MQTDLQAIGVLIVANLIISTYFALRSRKEFTLALATMYKVIDEKIQNTIDEVGGQFEAIFEKPVVKKAFGIIGSQGGQATADRALTDKIALDVLNGPKFASLKLIASGIGMDVDAYIEQHGAVNTINAINSLGGMIPGLDLGSLLSGGTNLAVGHEANGKHPYLGR